MEGCPRIKSFDQCIERKAVREGSRAHCRRRVFELENDASPIEAPAPLLPRAIIGLRLGGGPRGEADQKDLVGIGRQLGFTSRRSEVESLRSGGDDRNAESSGNFSARPGIVVDNQNVRRRAR